MDAVLGPPESGWVGGPRDSATDGHAARGGHAIRGPPLAAAAGPPRRPVADRLDQHAGPQLHLQAAGRRAGRGLRRRDVLRPVRDEPAAAGRRPRLRRHRLPAGRRGGDLCADLTRAVGPAGEPARDGRVDVAAQSRASGLCDLAPAALVTAAGETPDHVQRSHRSMRPASSPRSRPDGGARPDAHARASASRRRRPRLLGRVGVVDPTSLDDYRAQRRLRGPGPRLRDRPGGRHRRGHRLEADGPRRRRVPDRPQVGGGRRPSPPSRTTSSATPTSPSPGTFKDRVLLEGDPFATVEAMTIAAFATGASHGLPLHPRRVPGGRGARVATRSSAARAAGLLGPRHPRLGLRLRHRAPARRRRLHLRRGDGALRVDRGQARRAAQQAAVPGRGRAVRQADGRQQRRDAGQRAR